MIPSIDEKKNKYWFYAFNHNAGSGNGTAILTGETFNLGVILKGIKREKPEISGIILTNFFEISEPQYKDLQVAYSKES